MRFDVPAKEPDRLVENIKADGAFERVGDRTALFETSLVLFVVEVFVKVILHLNLLLFGDSSHTYILILNIYSIDYQKRIIGRAEADSPSPCSSSMLPFSSS